MFAPSRCHDPRRWLVRIVSIVGAALVTLPVAVRAQSPEATSDPKTAAREKALEGSRIADQGEHQRALELFRDAYALYPEPAYLYDMGVEYQALGHDVEALDAYTRFLADPRNTPRSLVTHAAELVAELDKKLGRLQLRGALDGAEIAVDDEARASTPLREPIRVKPGARRVTVRRPGFEPFSAIVDVPEGGTAFVDVLPMVPTEPAPSPEPRRRPAVAWNAALGAAFWTAGPPPGAAPSPTLAIGAALPLGALPGDVDFEAGAKVGFTYFAEPSGTSTFVSFLVNPRWLKSVGDRVRVFADVGLGVLVLSGVPYNSALFGAQGGRVTGPLGIFELRPAVGTAYSLTENLSIHLTPAFVWNPSPSERFRHAALTRFELTLGLMGEI